VIPAIVVILIHVINTIIDLQLLIKLYLGRCDIIVVDNRGTVVIL
jgi:hypothetical protein